MNQRGFITLIELLVALALGVVVMLGVGLLYQTVTWSYKVDQAQAFLQNQAYIVIDELRKQIEAGSTITLSDGTGDAPCLDKADWLYVLQPGGSIYCFYTANGQFLEYPQPAGSTSSVAWNLLGGSPVPITVTSLDFCGSTPYTTCQTAADRAYVSFQLQASGLLGGASAAPTMTFTVGIATRN